MKSASHAAISLMVLIACAPIAPVVAQQASPDRVALAALAKTSDLEKLHHVDFTLRFPTQKAAERAEVQLMPLAFATKLERAKSGSEWVVLASKRMYPVESDLMGLRDKLNVVAAAAGGTYDGWRAKLAD